ncbi:hypothetical protein ABH37_11090 [Mycobacterium haemophilum]|uniref:Uncharacterized protein n=1 Tax=Mycobacterium haemophilum TaxID=29311 RepID=A0A0I9ZAJ4_9MYCO|nr:hypothetical protein ABH39_08540 [Mycobacterium haemophilum]KLO36371.1 hypothetical protein ABH38_12460 [Mycobacterium haemophilum]KLO42255.1 hypothetical protein ABH37_11090 [Mycobacterium haemophilum]KLO50057.1 hypothetical protein ABH36_09010 [Mycobacterium haemophilum]
MLHWIHANWGHLVLHWLSQHWGDVVPAWLAVTGEPVRAALYFDVVDGCETVELDLFVAMQTQDRRVAVSWRPTPDRTGDPWTQRLGLP